MSWFGHRKEVQESDKSDLRTKNQILQTKEISSKDNEKLNPSERKRHDFVESLKASDNIDKDKLTRKPTDGNTSTEGDPTKGERIKERGDEIQLN